MVQLYRQLLRRMRFQPLRQHQINPCLPAISGFLESRHHLRRQSKRKRNLGRSLLAATHPNFRAQRRRQRILTALERLQIVSREFTHFIVLINHGFACCHGVLPLSISLAKTDHADPIIGFSETQHMQTGVKEAKRNVPNLAVLAPLGGAYRAVPKSKSTARSKERPRSVMFREFLFGSKVTCMNLIVYTKYV